jgi:CubicO group peptidase (beta-lactamase class C family)
MNRVWKTAVTVIAVVALICVVLITLNWPRVVKLYHVINLFDQDVIVENFMAMDQIFETKEIISREPPLAFPKSSVQLPESFEYKGKEQSLSEFLRDTQTTALLVLKGDTITHESYYLGTEQSDRRISWSVAKSFLSALVGIAVEQGKITNLEQAVTDYVPELKGSGYDGVSIKNVLQMSSGVKFNEDYQDFNSDINRFGRLMALGGSFDEFAASLSQDENIPEGEYLHYVSMDTHVLGMVLRKATGESIEAYFEKHLWTPLQPEASTTYIVDESGEPMVLGGLNMTTRDFAKFGKLYLDNGRWQGKQLVPYQWVRDSITPDAPHLVPGQRDNSDLDLGYGYQWWLPVGADQEFMAIGVYDQFIYVNQKAGVVIVKNSANTHFMDNNFESAIETVEAFRAISSTLTNL